ncbi:MAG: outer membrane protein assembly factor BamA [Cytophagales bacterium]|nr:MAG: outer membrane protein assembly factor BamA [Cytophagales bacterium]
MKVLSLSTLFVLLLLHSFYSNAQVYQTPKDYEIASITVTGANFLDPNAIVSISGLKVGDKIRIPGDALSEAIKKLWKQGILGDVKIAVVKTEGTKVYLNIHLSERPRVVKYTFTGVRKSETSTLNDKIGIIKGKTLSDVLLKNAQNNIKKYYKNKGFHNVEVNIEVVADSSTKITNGAWLKVNVDKKNKVKIEKILITGNSAIKTKKVKKKLKGTKEAKGFSFRVSKYLPDKYEEDKQKLIAFYNTKGYRDARITYDSVYSVNRKRLNVQMNIEEGKKYYFRNISWEGNYLYSDETLDKVLGIKKGEVYDVEKLDKKLSFSQTELDISSLYMDDGYLFFRVEPVEVAVENDSIDIEIRIFEGPQANVNKIVLNGNTKTNDFVVLRELRTLPGNKFSRSDLIRSQREIANLGYFDPEKTGLNPIPDIANGTVDIEYTVEEKPSDQIELSGGWGGAFGFVGTLGLVFNNFSTRNFFNFKTWRPLPTGDGQRLQIRFQANGPRFQTYSVVFTEPWLGGRKPQAFTVSFSHSLQRTIFNGVTIGSFKLYSVSLSLARRLRWPDDFFVLSNSVSYSYYDLFNFGGLPGFSNGIAQNLNLNFTLSRNSIDNPAFARSGSSMSLSLTLTPPWSLFENKDYSQIDAAERYRLVEYHKWMFDNSWFTTLIGKLVINARMHIGYIGYYNAALGVGPFERFLLGGAGLAGFNFLLGTEIVALRGYRDNSIRPFESDQGGIVFNKYVFELRYPFSLNPAATIYGLAFLEAGNNWGTYSDVNPFRMYRSAGAGVRILMPAFGLLGIDWAYGFDAVPGNPGAAGGQFHFTIGQQIR